MVGFERNSYVGGLWHFTEEDKTSVLPGMRERTPSSCSLSLFVVASSVDQDTDTVINISKERVSFGMCQVVEEHFWLLMVTATQGCFTDFPFPDGRQSPPSPSPPTPTLLPTSFAHISFFNLARNSESLPCWRGGQIPRELCRPLRPATQAPPQH